MSDSIDKVLLGQLIGMGRPFDEPIYPKGLSQRFVTQRAGLEAGTAKATIGALFDPPLVDRLISAVGVTPTRMLTIGDAIGVYGTPQEKDEWARIPEGVRNTIESSISLTHAIRPWKPTMKNTPKMITDIEELGLSNPHYEQIRRNLSMPRYQKSGIVKEEPGYLYHISPANTYTSISRNGLRSGIRGDPNKWEEGQNYFMGKLFAAKNLDEIGNVIDGVETTPDAWILYRFPDDGKWTPGPEGDVFKLKGKVSPQDIDVLTGHGWESLTSARQASE